MSASKTSATERCPMLADQVGGHHASPSIGARETLLANGLERAAMPILLPLCGYSAQSRIAGERSCRNRAVVFVSLSRFSLDELLKEVDANDDDVSGGR